MKPPPTLQTERLILRSFRMGDAPDVHRLVGDERIAYTTSRIPHPYEQGMAEDWIGRLAVQLENDESVAFAVVRCSDDALMGAISMHFNHHDSNAELGYWLGVPFWNQGYTTEAARKVLEYGFDVHGLHRIEAKHLSRNPASGRVMQKIGMTHEGELREHVLKWGVFENLTCYGILKSEFESDRERHSANG